MNNTGFQHLLDIESLNQQQLDDLLELSLRVADQPQEFAGRLAGKVLVNLFLEPSTRTRISFECAAKRLGMHVINFYPETSSSIKGEALIDTFHTLQAMQPDVIAVRHSEDGAVAWLADEAEPGVHVINAGDGCSEHPTQALLDAVTLLRAGGTLKGLKVAIVGDIKHSRVARSDIALLSRLGVAEIRLAGPPDLLPPAETNVVKLCSSLDEAVAGVDVIIMLRIQRERFGESAAPDESSYFDLWGLTSERMALAAARCVVLHPGPVNRGVEIASEVADGHQSLIRTQVQNGVYTRMAVLTALAG